MKIHEYQGKELLKRYGVPVPVGRPVLDLGETDDAVRWVQKETGIPVVVVKAQIHAGGRGKGGGVKVAKTPRTRRSTRAPSSACSWSRTRPAPKARRSSACSSSRACDIAREMYLGMVLDRGSGRTTVMVSTEGGMEIEEVAEKHPEKILKAAIDPAVGFRPFQARELAFGLGLKGDENKAAVSFLTSLYKAFIDLDCSLLEINPLVVTKEGDVVALDAKINFDDNALYRHPELDAAARPRRGRSDGDSRRRSSTSSFITLDGNIGCMVNGAGLAMATMDIIKFYGRRAGQLPRRRRRRHGGEGHRGVQDHHARPVGEGRSSSTSSAAS